MYDRLIQWDLFSEQVRRHIIRYTLEQYGNQEGNEQVDTFTTDDIWINCQRYYNRRNSAVRVETERLRDPIKVAHYMAMLYDKLKEITGESDVYEERCDPVRCDTGLG